MNLAIPSNAIRVRHCLSNKGPIIVHFTQIEFFAFFGANPIPPQSTYTSQFHRIPYECFSRNIYTHSLSLPIEGGWLVEWGFAWCGIPRNKRIRGTNVFPGICSDPSCVWWVVGWLAIRLAKVFAIKILQRVVSADMLTDIIFIHSVSLESVHAAV